MLRSGLYEVHPHIYYKLTLSLVDVGLQKMLKPQCVFAIGSSYVCYDLYVRACSCIFRRVGKRENACEWQKETLSFSKINLEYSVVCDEIPFRILLYMNSMGIGLI